MRIDLEVLSSFDFIITTSTSDGVCVSVYEDSGTTYRQILMSIVLEVWEADRQRRWVIRVAWSRFSQPMFFIEAIS